MVSDDDPIAPEAVTNVLAALEQSPSPGFLHLNYRTINFYDGAVVQERVYPWLEDQHEIYQEKYLERLRKIGDFYFNHRYYEDALEIYRKIYNVEPLNEWLNIRLLEIMGLLRNERGRTHLFEDMKKKYSIEEKDLEEYKDILFNL